MLKRLASLVAKIALTPVAAAFFVLAWGMSPFFMAIAWIAAWAMDGTEGFGDFVRTYYLEFAPFMLTSMWCQT